MSIRLTYIFKDAESMDKPYHNPLYLTEYELRQATELLFFSYRNFTQEPDRLLAELGLGRAHHRALYFIGRHPEMTVSELLGILAITKQSLNRVLNHLIQSGYVEQTQGTQDRRQRLLKLTEQGIDLEVKLGEIQQKRIAKAYKNAGVEAVDGFKKVMLALIDSPQDRLRFPEQD